MLMSTVEDLRQTRFDGHPRLATCLMLIWFDLLLFEQFIGMSEEVKTLSVIPFWTLNMEVGVNQEDIVYSKLVKDNQCLYDQLQDMRLPLPSLLT
jgi:hypothetical protein